MKSVNNLHKLFKKLHVPTSATLDEQINSEILTISNEMKSNRLAISRSNFWKAIIKNKMTKPAAAAVIIAATLIGLRWFGTGAPAYGITEALELWKNAETVHIKGWSFLHTGDDTQLAKFPFEIWFDRRNGCFKHWRPHSGAGIYTSETPRYCLAVSDGEYIMETSGEIGSNENSNPPLVIFTKLSPFEQRLQIRTMSPFPAYMANLDQVKGFTQVGREQIKNKTVDIWQGVITSGVPRFIKKKIWVSPETGEIVRIFTWINAGENSIRWVALSDADTIEYDAVPPANCFNTDPPAGHKQINTKKTVIERELADGSADAKFHSCIGFTLKDGTVIYGWHANNKPEESQAHLFTDLEPGGPLPNLPAKVVGLRPYPAQESIILAGRHLTFTRKKGKFYEWGIYASDEKTPERNTFAGYEIISKYNFGPRPFFDGRPGSLGQDHELAINSEEEFDIWVRGAMAELSDDGNAPESITYENVMQLAGKIRNTFNEQ